MFNCDYTYCNIHGVTGSSLWLIHWCREFKLGSFYSLWFVLHLLGERTLVVYITYTMTTWDLPDIYACVPQAWSYISGKSLSAMV